MSQHTKLAGAVASDLVQQIAMSLYGPSGAGITDLMTLADRVESSSADRLGLLLDQERVTIVADHAQAVPPATVGTHEVHTEVVDVRLQAREIRELGVATDALVHAPGVRQGDDRLMTPAQVMDPDPLILKGIGKINGDGWNDTTVVGEIVYVWADELPPPHAPGQFLRVGDQCGWTASTSQYEFESATPNDIRQAIEDLAQKVWDQAIELERLNPTRRCGAANGGQP